MNWASSYIAELMTGKQVQFRPRGNSMAPLVNDGDLVTVAPSDAIKVGDIVLCKVNGSVFLHLVSAIQGGRFQISNNRGHVNGWTKTIFGVVTKVER